MKEKNMSKHIDKNTQDIPKYLKPTESNISKSNRKSKHKHKYEECLIQHPFSFAGNTSIHTQLNSYCTICGKIGGYLKNGKYQTDEEMLEDNGYEDVVIYKNPNYDGALIGVTDNNIAVYDFDKMVDSLMKEDGLDEIEAIEWIEYNTMRANPYFENAPIIMYPINKEV